MINILEIAESYGGGVKTHIDYLDEYHDYRKYNLFFLLSDKVSKVKDDSHHFAYSDLSRFKNIHSLTCSIKYIHRLVCQHDIKIIHAHSTIAGLIVHLYKKIYRPKGLSFIYTPHAFYSEKSMPKLVKKSVSIVEKIIFSSFDRVIYVSQQESAHSDRYNIIPRDRSIVIYNGVKPPLVKKKIYSSTFPVVLSIGRLEKQKNPSVFVEIARMVLQEVPNVKFVFVGDGTLFNDMIARVEKYQLTKNIIFVGYAEDVSEYLQKADIYLSTSLYEGLPYSVIEAMSYGLPLVLSNVTGHAELVSDNGYLFSLEELGEAIADVKRLLDDLELRKTMGDESNKRFNEQFTAESNILKIFKVYEALLND